MYKIDKQQRYVVHTGKYSHCVLITLKAIKILNHYAVHLKLI